MSLRSYLSIHGVRGIKVGPMEATGARRVTISPDDGDDIEIVCFSDTERPIMAHIHGEGTSLLAVSERMGS